MIGRTISRYRILEELGRGGMGIVYRAEDTTLHRDVALKFLPPHISTSKEERVRFMTEAQAAAVLSHPNITHINTVEEAEGQVFIVMELVEGVELKQAVENGPLPVHEAVRIGRDIASGLQAAHDRGVIHRDIKSSNIMLTPDGQVKIMDFGLAKVQGGAQVTKVGTTVGTAAYMSPEQARGDEIDERTDIWSIGVVLYEMLSGRVPFRSDYEQAAIYSILNEEPEDLSSLRNDLPRNVSEAVKRALRKDPAERFPSARELQRALETEQSQTSAPDARQEPHMRKRVSHSMIATAAALVTIIVLAMFLIPESSGYDSLAVLPFENVGGDEGTEYLSDGITESLISSLSGLPELRVMSRNSVFRFKGTSADPKGIGEELNVGAVLSGRVQQRGGDLIVSVELIDVSDNSQLWGAQYTRAASGILAMQEEITQEISRNLRLRLGDQDADKVSRRPTENSEAYQLYLKGRYFWNKRTVDGARKAKDYFNQAVEKDPGYSLAYAGLADAYIILGGYNALSPADAFPAAKAAAERALSIDPSLAEAHASIGDIEIHYGWDWDRADRELRRAIEKDPGYATAHHWYGEYLFAVGRHDEGIEIAKRARELDPLSPIISTYVGWNYFMARNYVAAKAEYEKTIALSPDFPWVRMRYAECLEQLGLYDDMIKEHETAAGLYDHPMILGGLGHGYAVAGRRKEAEEVLSRLLAAADGQYISPHYIAQIHLGLGNRDETLDWLEKAVEDRSPLLFTLRSDPAWDPIRKEPRFRAILEKIGLAEY